MSLLQHIRYFTIRPTCINVLSRILHEVLNMLYADDEDLPTPSPKIKIDISHLKRYAQAVANREWTGTKHKKCSTADHNDWNTYFFCGNCQKLWCNDDTVTINIFHDDIVTDIDIHEQSLSSAIFNSL